MSKRVSIDPVTRLEGHGRIHIFLDNKGKVRETYLQIPDFKGFEKFCEGRPAEEMPVITEKICGVCPTAHHTASSKALDELFDVEPPVTAKLLRELMYCAFVFEDHLLHFYFFGGPDFIVGPHAPASQRNIFGMARTLGKDFIKEMMDVREKVRSIIGTIGGSALYPVCGLPGGVSKPITEQERMKIQDIAKQAQEFALKTLDVFHNVVLGEPRYRDMLRNPLFDVVTYYMGLVDQDNMLNFYDGKLRVVDPDGNEFIKFYARDYLAHVAEKAEPWTYQKSVYLQKIGWSGFVEGPQSGIFRVGPLARLNVSEGIATSLAQSEYEKMYAFFGCKPIHNTLGYHWARLIEALYASERMSELADQAELACPRIRNIPSTQPLKGTGIGVCEAPRGTLIHHYESDEKAILTHVNLIVATQNNAAAISMSIDKVARKIFNGDNPQGKKVDKIEMVFRAYDPCLACATHLVSRSISTDLTEIIRLDNFQMDRHMTARRNYGNCEA